MHTIRVCLTRESFYAEIEIDYSRRGSIMSEIGKNMGKTLISLIDQLAGKGSDIKLSFQDLTFEVGMMKAKLNGAIILDIQYVSEKT